MFPFDAMPAMTGDQGPVRVLIVAHDPLARAGLAALLASAPGCAVVGQTAPDELAGALDVYRPDVLLWDSGWDSGPDHLPDLEAAAWETDEHNDVPPIVMLVSGAGETPIDLWTAGAAGLLLRASDADRLGAALKAAAHGLMVLDPALVASAPRAPAPHSAADLTPREIEVVALLAEGLANRAIAARLGISEHTVKFHLNAILSKLGAQSRTEAVVQAIRLGVIAL